MPQTKIDIQTELSAVREQLETLPKPARVAAIQALSQTQDALTRPARDQEKVACDKDAIGRALDQAIEHAKEADAFSQIVDALEPHIARAVAWLGPDWQHIANLLRSKELGQKFPVEVRPYDPRWPALYEKEATFLRAQFGPDVLVRTAHFGSTAVPGLAAKPVIDVLVEVTSFETAKREMIPQLEAQGYLYFWRSDSPPGHIMLIKGYDVPGAQKYHLHAAPAGHPLWERLLFRDYMRAHPETAARYQALKQRLAEQHRNDREAYTRGKAEFVIAVTRQAQEDHSPTAGSVK